MVTTIISFIIVFGILVFVHEFGHFIVAKRAGIMVREFSIGMGPKLLFYRKNHTTYTIRLLPLGGYVRLAGSGDDDDEDLKPGTTVKLQLNQQQQVTKIDLSDKSNLFQGIPVQVTNADLVNDLEITGYENGDESELKHFRVNHDAVIVNREGIELQIAPADVQFQNAPVSKKLMVNAAGIVNNILLAIVAFTLLSFLQGGVPQNSNQIQLPAHQPSVARQAGLQSGDRIIAVDGQSTPTFNAVAERVSAKPNQRIRLTVVDHGRKRQVSLKTTSQKVQKRTVGMIGVTKSLDSSFTAKLTSGFSQTWQSTKQLGAALWRMVSGHFSLNDLGGPVAIYASTSQATTYGLVGVVSLLAWLSINLAVVNLIPIPALDGGKILLNLIELIRRKPLSENVETAITLVGFACLAILMILVTWNDIMRYFIH
ncbi:RIP metalloprotease RseP [Fructilactobacillus myrtifloralis]|uniref:Zinc metalloprotease n=1 Tax=Fructilactobacillus myrtifloralis TaxID=2940301 RepID=A0ABY5BR89_9LACO|nr:RIP metalloprotease RseP [Fructilactobacillus myrtifloralis]USS85431.1 RIP metalloprotease RseP [Fructilactobacillus myrtifloralis]